MSDNGTCKDFFSKYSSIHIQQLFNHDQLVVKTSGKTNMFSSRYGFRFLLILVMIIIVVIAINFTDMDIIG